jgi:hypothetical protein
VEAVGGDVADELVVDGGDAFSTFTDVVDGGDAFTRYGPDLTAVAAMAPVPHVELVFTGLDPAAVTATVYRIADGRTTRVRGLIDVDASGGFGGIDTEAPTYGVPVSYRAQLFAADGSDLGFTESSTTAVEFYQAVIHQPLDPRRAAVVDLRPEFAQTIQRSRMGDIVYPLGRPRGVWVSTGSKGITGLDLTVVTDTLEQADALLSVWGKGDDVQIPVICLRVDPVLRLPMPLFAAVPEPVEQRPNPYAAENTIDWPLKGDEVDPPAEAIVQALLTYADLEAVFPDYDSLEAAYLTYLDMETDFDLAGSAA